MGIEFKNCIDKNGCLTQGGCLRGGAKPQERGRDYRRLVFREDGLRFSDEVGFTLSVC